VARNIQGLSMEVDLYVLPMKGLDMVLGIQWLQKLGKGDELLTLEAHQPTSNAAIIGDE
ncbi:hypothetical protein Tco_0198527, partial [Tanacetum coccineum]